MDYYYIAAKNILGVKTNIREFKWSFGHSMPESTEEEYEQCEVKINLVMEEFNEDDQLEGLGKYHYFNGSPGENKIYYTRNLAMKEKLRIKAENLLSDEPKITVNKNYYKLITHRVMNLHSIGYILTDLAGVLLLRKGFAPIHCSAFKKNNSTVAIFAPPNTGKTLSSMMACMEHQAKFIAEDLAITDGKRIYSVPWTSSFRFYSNMEQSKGAKLRSKAKKMFPPLEYVSLTKATPVTRYVDSSEILEMEEVTHIAVLEKGESEIIPQTEHEAVRKLINFNRNAFHYLKSPLLTAYEFFNSELNIDQAAANEREILNMLVKNSKKIFSVKDINPTHYAQIIINQITEETLA